MNFLAEIRLQNMKNLVEEAGSVAELAKRAGYAQPSYLYQIINQTAIQNGKPKNIGGAMARKLESAMNKAEGWLDMNHGETLPLPPEDTETIRIDHLDMAGACGGGIEADDWPSPSAAWNFPSTPCAASSPAATPPASKSSARAATAWSPPSPKHPPSLSTPKPTPSQATASTSSPTPEGLYTKRLQKTPARPARPLRQPAVPKLPHRRKRPLPHHRQILRRDFPEARAVAMPYIYIYLKG
ncbi:hypothetical protein ACR30T_05885 [Neisseria gonorrhoeae]